MSKYQISGAFCIYHFLQLESEAVYSCTSCEISFNSVLEHIKQFHDGQEVLLEMAEQLDDLTTAVPVSAVPVGLETSENATNARQRQTMNTLRTEECVDNEGRLYTRKVVQIERFWDRTPIQVTSSQSAKAPMIEKFFSNVEGVKVHSIFSGRVNLHGIAKFNILHLGTHKLTFYERVRIKLLSHIIRRCERSD